MSRKKVGILTFHRADNLGAVLQAFALQQTVEKECEADAEIIDYKCSMIESTKRSNPCRSVKDCLKFPLMSAYYYIKRRGFDRFRSSKLKQSSQQYHRDTISESVSQYDIVITGSDQVWNPGCSGDDYTYFLDYFSTGSKKISYAASIGKYQYKANESEKVASLLKAFAALSVREKSAAEELSRIGVDNVQVCPDPVMLLTAEQWKTQMPRRLCKQKYVLVYLVLPDDKVMKSAQEYAERHGYKAISNKKSLEFIFHNSPDEFLSWVYYAECVFTNSFHGTAFSLIFNKPLAADVEMTDGRKNNRVNDLLALVGAEQCVLNKNDIHAYTPNVEGVLSGLKEQGITYLKRHCG